MGLFSRDSNKYSGITDNPDSWGMCRSEKSAKRCADEYYDMVDNSEKEDLVQLIIVLLLGLVFIAVSIKLGIF